MSSPSIHFGLPSGDKSAYKLQPIVIDVPAIVTSVTLESDPQEFLIHFGQNGEWEQKHYNNH